MRVPYSELKKGIFLIASPDIGSGVFFRGVVLLCDHSSMGSLGLIVNKPLEVDMLNVFSEFANLPDTPIQTRAGGPNQPHQIMILQNYEMSTGNSVKICDDVYINEDFGVPQHGVDSLAGLTLLCFGYSGWEGGALEREFLNGTWFLHPANSSHIFNTSPDLLWRTLLREMGSKYKTLSMLPDDLDLN